MKKIEIFIIFCFSIAFILFFGEYYFFWDNISSLSRPANYYYNNNFATIYPPKEFTTGHQTFYAMYIALGWKILGKSIFASHLLMLPFVFGVVYQLLKFIRYFVKNDTNSYIILFICLIDSVFISQLSLISFEVPHLFFYLATLNALLRKENWKTAVYFLVLIALISLRASLSAFAIIAFYFLYEILILRKFKIKSYLVFAPGIVGLLVFLLSFYLDKGWIIYSYNGDKIDKIVGIHFMARNFIVFFWRLLDFGRIVYGILFFIIVYQIVKYKKADNNFYVLMLIAFTQFFVFFSFIIPSIKFVAHRYLLPFTIVFEISIVYWFLKYKSKEKYYIVYIILFLISGYFWIYPEKIAKGWDSMPSHISYYELRKDAIDYLEKNKIPIEKTGTGFMNTSTFENIELISSKKKFKEIDLKKDNYILYSNVFNESDETIDLLTSKSFKPIFYREKGAVHVIVYKRVKK